MRADQIKASLWAEFHRQATETLMNSVALAQAQAETLAQENTELKAKIAELEKKATPQPEILTPPVVPPPIP